MNNEKDNQDSMKESSPNDSSVNQDNIESNPDNDSSVNQDDTENIPVSNNKQDNAAEDISDNDTELTAEIEEEFRKEISFDKEEKAASDEELYLRMKRRIVRSYRWQEDLIKPFSTELKITPEELEEILMKRLDMSSLEAIHPRAESSRYRCTKERVHSDLKLCWVYDVMNLLTDEEAEDIKNRITTKILQNNEPYEKALEEGRREMVEYLKR